MEELLKGLEIAKKALKKRSQKPKLTPEQFLQLAKVKKEMEKILMGKQTVNDLSDKNKEMLIKLAKTFIEEAEEKAKVGEVGESKGGGD
ncbi:hypothetical protein TUMSATVNIG1_04030 [Vibrio nigripulchritudo]|uniref:hypothetical protein n=1 Tax=Vibrio nigripulchritudo TaxID=28173 RepID=UPI0019099C03|nr:hypothetical protein [Vibrio nigripulchritudo]BCL68466.1 hypothetical protein VNTUMSATTG_04030 [Vibrio nigripulchritudo]BDU29794.1 hypothetical protein TUMSATVNIG1_04030 [Vibrio nigripulchritudo]